MKNCIVVFISLFGFITLITLSSCSENKGGSANETAEWVEITHVNTYMNDYNTIISYAVVKNVLDVPIENVFIIMALKNAEGEELKLETCTTSMIPPGASIPVKILFRDGDKIEWEKVEPRVWKGKKLEKRAIHTDFRLENVTLEDDPGSSYIKKVTGTVLNTGDTKAEWVSVWATFFDNQDKVVAYATSGIGVRDLAPGKKGNFSAGTNTAAGNIERVEVTIKARSPEWHDAQKQKQKS